MKEGLTFENKCIRVTHHCSICDAPAKEMVKGIKSYSSYYGWDRCDQKGVWDRKTTYEEG